MITELKLRPLYSNYSTTIPHWTQPLSDYGGKSSRWNPTVEQLRALEDMYGRGTTTPSAQQIQQIAAKLTRFGKIEGKNVFYWFQNHKARDTQKRRRTQFQLDTHNIPHPTVSGLNKRPRLEIEHRKKLPTPSNCSTASKNSESTHGAVDQELQKKYSDDVKGRGPENAHPFVALNFWKMLGTKSDNFRDFRSGKENKTLELFPMKSSNEEESDDDGSTCRLVPNYKFIEFLPTKN